MKKAKKLSYRIYRRACNRHFNCASAACMAVLFCYSRASGACMPAVIM